MIQPTATVGGERDEFRRTLGVDWRHNHPREGTEMLSKLTQIIADDHREELLRQARDEALASAARGTARRLRLPNVARRQHSRRDPPPTTAPDALRYPM